MPAPEPVPSDGGAEGMAAADGMPKFGILFSARRTCGGITTVGSAVSLGCWFRRIIEGGVICCIANFGNLPLGATPGRYDARPQSSCTCAAARNRYADRA